MNKPVSKSHKIIGILSVLFGLMAFIPFIYFDENKLVWNEANHFIGRYSLVLSLISGGLFFIIMGILQYIGFLIPYYVVGENKYEKAKIHVTTTILSIPILFSLSIALFSESDNTKIKIVWSIMLFYIAWLFISGVKTIKNHPTN
jgi:hypothetical protein